ncbi:MAG: hypothetical protein JXR68_00270 [Bacteroidales bacterium]|nr:hypothetical protein [Bacteroidales bacterium]
MSTILLIGLNTIITLFGTNYTNTNNETFPEKQIAEEQILLQSANYYYSQNGKLIKTETNNSEADKYFVIIDQDRVIEIKLTNSNKIVHGNEIGYLARILSAETLIYEKNDKVYNISMFTRICIAETIKNRKNSNLGFYKNYKTFKSVITNTGYATNAKQYTKPFTWMENKIAKKRFVQEVLPAAIYIYFYNTNHTNGATGFITPAKMSTDMYQKFKKRTLIEIPGIDPFYEFTFWRY